MVRGDSALGCTFSAIHRCRYDLDAIRAGECRLRDYELQEVGDVKGKTLLHLMCRTWVFPDDAAGELPLFFTLKATKR